MGNLSRYKRYNHSRISDADLLIATEIMTQNVELEFDILEIPEIDKTTIVFTFTLVVSIVLQILIDMFETQNEHCELNVCYCAV